MAYYITTRHISLLLIIMVCSFMTIGQPNSLRKNDRIDTLYVFLQFTDSTDNLLQKELITQFDSIVIDFNKKNNSIILKVDSSRKTKSIKFLMGKIKYVDWKRNLWVTGLDLAMVGANILILPYFPPCIPFYLMPATYCKVDIICSSELLLKCNKFFINSNGYITKKEKQKIRFKKKFNKIFSKFFLNIHKK